LFPSSGGPYSIKKIYFREYWHEFSSNTMLVLLTVGISKLHSRDRLRCHDVRHKFHRISLIHYNLLGGVAHTGTQRGTWSQKCVLFFKSEISVRKDISGKLAPNIREAATGWYLLENSMRLLCCNEMICCGSNRWTVHLY
jgi:hypothetical protein